MEQDNGLPLEENHLLTARIYTRLAELYQALGRIEEAKALFRQAITHLEQS
jgi:Tfp pilus assembly protein PilF